MVVGCVVYSAQACFALFGKGGAVENVQLVGTQIVIVPVHSQHPQLVVDHGQAGGTIRVVAGGVAVVRPPGVDRGDVFLAVGGGPCGDGESLGGGSHRGAERRDKRHQC